jgi:hypothetical protein
MNLLLGTGGPTDFLPRVIEMHTTRTAVQPTRQHLSACRSNDDCWNVSRWRLPILSSVHCGREPAAHPSLMYILASNQNSVGLINRFGVERRGCFGLI